MLYSAKDVTPFGRKIKVKVWSHALAWYNNGWAKFMLCLWLWCYYVNTDNMIWWFCYVTDQSQEHQWTQQEA